MSCETFAEGRSCLHRADPRGKILAAAAFSFTVALSQRFGALLPALAVGIVLVLLAKLPPRRLLARLATVNFFILLLWILLPLTTRDGAVIAWAGPDLSRAGLHLAAVITLKANAIVLALIALVTTSTVNALGKAMEGLAAPEKLVHLLLFTYRYIDVIAEERVRLLCAMKARGFVSRLSMNTLRGYGWLVGMLLVKSYDRSVRVYQAMLCRGYRGRFYTLSPHRWKRSDSLLLAGGLAAAILVGYLQWGRTTW